MFFSIAGLVKPKPVAPLAESSEAGSHRPSRVKLPAPDLQNITVLSRKLPNLPILPWNHYDSPWLEVAETAEAEWDASEN